MKEHLIRSWCDAHLGDDGEGRVEADGTHAVRIDGLGGELDLCEEHGKALLGPLIELIGSRGVPAKLAAKPAPAPERNRCELCGVRLTRGAVVGHVYNVHVGKRPEPVSDCPECGLHNEDPRAMGAHRRAAHGWNAVETAYALARARGAR